MQEPAQKCVWTRDEVSDPPEIAQRGFQILVDSVGEHRRLCLEFALRTTWDSESSVADELRQAIFLRPHRCFAPRSTASRQVLWPRHTSASRRHDWYLATGRIGRWVIPDWTQVQHDIDAVHVSAGGYLTTAGLAIPVEDDLATVLAGWNPDQTYWFRDVTRSASTHQAWTYDQKDENWEVSTAR